MEAYYPFKGEAGASIAVELFHGKQSVPKHFHEFNEFVLVLKGTCKHRFGSQESILIPGDIFLVPAHKSHEYIIESSLTIYNVQFYPRRLEKLWGGSWPSHLYQNEKDVDKVKLDDQWAALFPPELGKEVENSTDEFFILRLNSSEREYISALLGYMYREQQQRSSDYQRVLRSYLEIVLVELNRVRSRQISMGYPQNSPTLTSNTMKYVVQYIEDHLAEEIDFHALAAEAYMSVNYFRTVFKQATGLSPIDYLNRKRIIKSLHLLQTENLPIREVAALVGIQDPNYFSRLFKKIIGYPPKYFKHIGE
ncbi:MAG: AraC family transcriptional regulator [Oscillospiraceae bacterium]|jgi:AraC-like DNA-binding protein